MRNEAASAAEKESAKNEKLMADILEDRKKEIQKLALLAKDEAADHTMLHKLSSRMIELNRPIFSHAIMIDGFPTEIKSNILNNLPVILSLHSLISSSPSCYSCYIFDSPRIFCNVLVNEMTLPIFLQAVAIFSEPVRKMHFKNQWNEPLHNVYEFMCKYSKEAKATTLNPRTYELKTLIRIAKFHSTIKAISQDYFESCLRLHPWTHQKYEKSALEKVETLRIQRALYNVELYFRMFKRANRYFASLRNLSARLHTNPNTIYRKAINRSFFEHFSCWEIEEMYSIIDYMEREYHYVFENCKMLGQNNSQVESYRSLSILANLRSEDTRYVLFNSQDNGIKDTNPSNRHNDLGFALISMGLGFFWKVRKQDTPEGLIFLLDKPIQRLTGSRLAVHKTRNIWAYLIVESFIHRRIGGAPTARYSELNALYIKCRQNRSSVDQVEDIVQALKTPSSAFASSWMITAFRTGVLPTRDYFASWGYCMWTADRVHKIGHIYWPSRKSIIENGAKHGPRKLITIGDGTKGRYGLQ